MAASLSFLSLACQIPHKQKGSLIIDSVKNSKEELEPDLGGCIPELGSGQVRKAGVRQQSKLPMQNTGLKDDLQRQSCVYPNGLDL